MNTIAPFLTEAENSLLDHDITRAAKLYQLAHQADQDRSPLPAVGIARVAMLVGKHHEAALILDRVLSRHANSVEALTFRGVADDAQGKTAEAYAWLVRAVHVDPSYGPAQANLGRVAGQLGRWKEALTALKSAVTLAPDQRELVPMLAYAALKAGVPGEALLALTTHLERDPDHLDAIITLVDILAELGETALAFSLIKDASARLTESPTVFARMAALAVRQGDIETARTAVARQLELLPTDEEAWLFAASLEIIRLDVTEAERMVQKVIALNPTSWRAHFQLGMIYESLRMFDAAKRAYTNAITCGPRAWEPRNNLATLLLEDRNREAAQRARALLDEAVALAPPQDSLQPRYNLALACWQLGDHRASEAAARQVASSGLSGDVVDEARRFLGNFTPRSRA